MTTKHLDEFIKGIPKAELHLHIEGTLEPELMFEIARRNDVSLRFGSVDELRKAYEFENLQSFLDIYYEGAKVLLAERDFYELAWSYLERAHKDNVRHVEIFFDPQTHTDRGISFKTVVNGLFNALSDAESTFGISSCLIMSFLRHLSVDSAMDTLIESLKYKDKITAVGLDSSEVGYPPENFARVFERAHLEGFEAVAHAGEEGPPSYIWQALDLLQVKRIDHGVRCIEDQELMARLKEEQVPLTVCPLSNLKLRVVDSLKDHPLRELLSHGLCATVNSDDPSYFGGYVTANFQAAQQALDLSKADIEQLARNSFQAGFLPESKRKAYFDEVNEFIDNFENVGS